MAKGEELDRGLRWSVAVVLLVSFLCNLAVLFVPFMDLRRGVMTEPYSLFRSVQMFWSSGLYVLAILVVAFSVVFPFAKLAVLAAVTLAGKPDARLREWLHWAERLAKWSMLDVFLVCLILVLTSDQVFVGATPLMGIPLFITAILLSMAAGEVLSAALRPSRGENDRPPIPPRGSWLLCSGFALGATLSLPFLGVADWRLVDRDYSIVGLVPVLWTEGAWLAAVLAGLFLVGTPVAAWMLSFASWWRLRGGDDNDELNVWAAGLRRWSMLEVFGLALAVFALEGDHLMKTEMRWGALLLAVTMLLQRSFDFALTRRRLVDDED
ncbi:paraquat-inducible protein A [Actomonas aquatica]|uniref:Paraquat-inducible protein A n=1 Tax=Actomonas aquatica TaxID=2866162 RepID=A0ABZ1CHC0_9BACT|nr:paraquat-inducible protein A [Opitutus sp. WL0086]WRQ89979.1 paraquat-inducible protein A [Opitutus sp. WL0086]